MGKQNSNIGEIIIRDIIIALLVAIIGGVVVAYITGEGRFAITPSPIPQNSPTPGFSLTNKPAIAPSPTEISTTVSHPSQVSSDVYDDFNNPSFDGSFNQSLWQYWTGSTGIFQKDGVLVISTNATNLPGLIARRFTSFTLNSPIFYQARLKMSSTAHTGNVNIKINVDLPGGDYWDSECDIGASASDTMGWAFCLQSGRDEANNELNSASDGESVNFDTWHTFRIEVDPTTMNFTYYIDGQMVDSQVAKYSNSLKNDTVARLPM